MTAPLPEMMSFQQRVRYLAGLMFLILLNANLLRSIKDSVVPLRLGVEAISFVRIYFELPFLVLCMGVYRVCMKRFSQLLLFRGFCAFYAVISFLWVLYTRYAVGEAPACLTPWARCWADFPYALIYILFDLWPLMAYTNFYWELSSRLFSKQEAKTAYPQFTLIGQSNLFISGILIILCALSQDVTDLCPLQEPILIALIVCVNCIMIERIYTHLSPDARVIDSRGFTSALGLWEIWKAPVFLQIFFSLIAYTAAICVIEMMCLHHLRKMFCQTQHLILVQGFSILGLGCLMTLFSLYGRRILSRLPLSRALEMLPISLCIGGGSAFIALGNCGSAAVIVGLFLTTFVGVRALKYAIYDPAKEMLILDLPTDMKRVGRIVDMSGIGWGRFLAHLFPVLILQVFPDRTYDTLFPVMAFYFLFFVLVLWVSTRRMGRAL